MSETEHEHDDDEAVSAPETDDEADEAAEAEDEPGEPHEPADEAAAPPEAVGPSPEEWEDRFKKINARYKTYTRAIGTILEEDATDLLPCPLCSDAVPGFVNGHDAGKVPDETIGAVQAFMGYQGPASLNKSRLNTRCVECGGRGELDTDSLVPQFQSRVCDGCNGFGYRGPGNPMDAVGPPPPTPAEPGNNSGVIDLSLALASINQGATT